MTSGRAIQWIGPLPPLRTGIAAYCHDLLTAVDGRWEVEFFPEAGSGQPRLSTVRSSRKSAPDDARPLVIQIGNSEHHERGFQAAEAYHGIVVLHDVVLHHALLARHVRRRTDAEYWDELRSRYGAEGVAVGRSILAGRALDDLQRFPLSERFIERARLVVVHSEYARREVERIAPGAAVQRVPMGIPLPEAIRKREARRLLGLSESQFVVGSITHVNPNKRIPSVLRAMRRLVARVPDSLLLLAGSGSDSAEVRREVRLLGLERHAKTFGYVDEATARLLAASADVCVNLRYPSTGETSASLLRLLGAGRPVLITDDGAGSEVPDHIAFKVPPAAGEIDIIEEVLLELEASSELRETAGIAAREWVKREHSMGTAVAGYCSAIRRAYGLDLPLLEERIVRETIDLSRAARATPPAARVARDRASILVGDAIGELGLAADSPVVAQAAQAITDLGLHRVRMPNDADGTRHASERLVARMACPVCGAAMQTADDALSCVACGAELRTRSCVPDTRKVQLPD